jgi:hypothetical protein
VPTLIYLHKKQMYVVPPTYMEPPPPQQQEEGQESSTPSNPIPASLKSFLLEEYSALAEGQSIPDPPSPLDALKESLLNLYDTGKQSPLLGIAILFLASMLFLTILALVYALVTGSATSDAPKPKKN